MRPPTKHDAARRATVQTTDGLWGTLLWVARDGGKTKIECGGRHYTVPADTVYVVPANCEGDLADHINDAADDWTEETGA